MKSNSWILQFFSIAAGLVRKLYSQSSLMQTAGLKEDCRILHAFLLAALITILQETSLGQSAAQQHSYFFLKSKDGDKKSWSPLKLGWTEQNTAFLSLFRNCEQLASQILTLILATLNQQHLAFLSSPYVRRGPELASPPPYSLKQPIVTKGNVHFRTTAFKGMVSGDETVSGDVRGEGKETMSTCVTHRHTEPMVWCTWQMQLHWPAGPSEGYVPSGWGCPWAPGSARQQAWWSVPREAAMDLQQLFWPTEGWDLLWTRCWQGRCLSRRRLVLTVPAQTQVLEPRGESRWAGQVAGAQGSTWPHHLSGVYCTPSCEDQTGTPRAVPS